MARRVLAPELVAAFERGLPLDERVTRRVMFGCPCAFANGAMFMGVHTSGLFLRLGSADRARMMAEHGAGLFDPNGGRPMREYVVLPECLSRDVLNIINWIHRSFSYALTISSGEGFVRKRKAINIRG